MKDELKRQNVNIQPKDYEVFERWSNIPFSTWVRDELAKWATEMRARREDIRQHHLEEGRCGNI